jgi:hypothetical protein
MRRWVTLLVVGGTLAMSYHAGAITISAIDGIWGTTDGSNVNRPSGVSTPYGNGLQDQVRWGVGAPTGWFGQPGPQSGLGFTGNAPPGLVFNIGDAFEIGELQHFNNPINSGTAATSSSLDIVLTFTDPLSLGNQSMPFSFDINETPNVGGPASDDHIYFSSPYSSTFFDIGGVDYTLEIIGFGSDANNTISSFTSPEGGTNSTLLFGRLTAKSNIPGPSVPDGGTTLVLLGLSLSGLGLARRFARS